MASDPANSDSAAPVGGYGAESYGDSLGADYDQLYPPQGLETAEAVQFLAELAGSHPSQSVLEFGIGTGRIAIELHHRGFMVAGIEASSQMISTLRRKAPDAHIEVALGDYLSTQIPRTFGVVAAPFNAVLDERGLDAQLAIFENATRHLHLGGFFVVEALVLGEDAMDGGWTISPRYVGDHHVELQMVRYDIDSRSVERTLVHLRPDGPHFITVRDSYASPAELDVMAHVNAMKRVARYSDWTRTPFTARSRRHVSVYQRRR